jgi:hypothetical protein
MTEQLNRIPQAFSALIAIAKEIEPAEKAWLAAWALDAATPGKELEQAILSATKTLNQAIEPKVAAIAQATGNSESTIRSVYAPREFGHTWFTLGSASPSKFLLKVAEHQSFNEEFWRSQERKAERCDLESRVNFSLTPMPARMAAKCIREGSVAHIQDTAAQRTYAGRLSHFELQLVEAGLLARYDSSAVEDRVSATQSFAYVVHGRKDGSDTRTFCLWPAHRSARHIESSPIVGNTVQPEDREEATAPVPGNT